MKKIYLIKRTDIVNYYEFSEVVIIAETAQEAKKIAFQGYDKSFAEGKIICELIGTANKNANTGEVISSFNAG